MNTLTTIYYFRRIRLAGDEVTHHYFVGKKWDS